MQFKTETWKNEKHFKETGKKEVIIEDCSGDENLSNLLAWFPELNYNQQ